jgi:type II secretory pathway component PulC
MINRLIPIAICALTGACGGAAEQTAVAETDIASEYASMEVETIQDPVEPGTISRRDLDELLAHGPAPILAMVLTEPHRRAGRFVGFRIVAFPAGDPTAVDLRTGDVILAINGRRIERPEHYFEVFEALKTADEIELRLEREGRDQTLTYPIVP